VRDAGEKLPADVKADVEEKIKALLDTLKTDDIERIKSAAEALRQSSTKIGEALYKADQAAQAKTGQPEGEPAGATTRANGGKKDDTIEGEFKEQS
jgi:molecular chaperone DnaK